MKDRDVVGMIIVLCVFFLFFVDCFIDLPSILNENYFVNLIKLTTYMWE